MELAVIQDTLELLELADIQVIQELVVSQVTQELLELADILDIQESQGSVVIVVTQEFLDSVVTPDIPA